MAEEQRLRLLRHSRHPMAGGSTLGREAIAVGAAIGLLPADTMAPGNYDLATNIVRDTPLKRVFLHWREHNLDPSHRPSIAAQMNIATGIALARATRSSASEVQSVVLAIAGTGGSALDFWPETLRFAALRKLPIVYVAETGFTGVDQGPLLAKASAVDLSGKRMDCGLPRIVVDGSDAVAVYRVCYEAIEHARKGYGPTLVECRNNAGHDAGRKQSVPDPIAAMEHYLRQKGLWDDEWKSQLVSRIKQELAKAVQATIR